MMTNHSENPFALAERPASALADAGIAREAQEVQAMVLIAKRFPRDPVRSMDLILQAASRPTLAESSLYSYTRGGTEITGPSIRLAEAICQGWGNMDVGFKEVARGIGPDKVGYSEVLAFAWDMETNARKSIAFRVRHWRDTKKGGYALTDERDIYELVANQASRRGRNCILSVVPGDVVEAAQRQCEITLSAHADTSPEALKKLVAAFAEFGVSKEQIEQRIQRRIETITPAQIISFKKIYSSLRDSMSSPKDWFDVPADSGAPEKSKKVAEKINDAIRKGGDTTAAPSEQEPASRPDLMSGQSAELE